MNIYYPIFIPIYLALVVFLIWYASSLALSQIQFAPTKVSWSGIAIVVFGFAAVQYVEYSKRYQYKPYTREEVAKHKTMEDGVWLIVNNDVYDVTDFVKKHPAGKKIILNNSGKDATRHYDYHLEATKHFWRRAKIGWIVESDGHAAESKV